MPLGDFNRKWNKSNSNYFVYKITVSNRMNILKLVLYCVTRKEIATKNIEKEIHCVVRLCKMSK
jgi:hypothetical protein